LQSIKGQLDANAPFMPVADSPPDVTSIMMYGLMDFVNHAECAADKFKCPMLKWQTNEHGEHWGAEFID
jgi:hypothetical protein